MKMVILIYVLGLIPAYLSLRHSFIRLCGFEGRSIGDALLMTLCVLCSWISVVVSMTMLSLLAVEDIDREPASVLNHMRGGRSRRFA